MDEVNETPMPQMTSIRLTGCQTVQAGHRDRALGFGEHRAKVPTGANAARWEQASAPKRTRFQCRAGRHCIRRAHPLCPHPIEPHIDVRTDWQECDGRRGRRVQAVHTTWGECGGLRRERHTSASSLFFGVLKKERLGAAAISGVCCGHRRVKRSLQNSHARASRYRRYSPWP